MSLPNYLARIKSSGIYRYVWDKSVVPTQVAETLRLVVGYSDKGPFNTPVYIDKVSDFIETYGNISKKMERKGIFFNRLAIQALATGPILALNLKPFDSEAVKYANFNFDDMKNVKTDSLQSKPVKELYDTNRFWKLDADQLPSKLDPTSAAGYMFLTATDTKDQSCTVFMRKSKHAGSYDIKIQEWYQNGSNNGEMPEYLEPIKSKRLSDFFVDVYVFRGKFGPDVVTGPLKEYFTPSDFKLDKSYLDGIDTLGPASKSKTVKSLKVAAGVETPKLNVNYKDAWGNPADALDAMANDPNSNLVAKYTGITLPNFKGSNGGYVSIDILFNSDHFAHKMLMKLNEGKIYDNATYSEEKPDEYLKFLFPEDIPEGEVANIENLYVEGYTYAALSGEITKQQMQGKILAMLNDKGLYTGLTNRTDAEYRYIVDTFESFVDAVDENGVETSCKGKLAALAKAKDNAFAILNFPPIQSFIDSNNPIFKDNKGRFDITKIPAGFDLASENSGASWCAYFTSVKFSDGSVKSYVPSAALVSNRFMDKYGARLPYYIVAGPNYGQIDYDGMVGPDYNYGREDLDVLEPMGVNAIIYVPRKGTFINSNQTAKQKPVSGLSKIHIRELVIFMQDEIESMLQDYQWELNTQELRDTIKSKADSICDRIMNNGGLYAYINICDETNNTPEVIDNEMVVLDTAIEPSRGAGKMVQTLTIHKTGGITSK